MLELSRQFVYRFADVEVDAARGCVRRGGEELRLRRQTLQVLLYLIERRERLVTKEELFEHIWKGTAVTDNALLQCIFDIRRALGDDSRRPRFIRTFPKSGYRFIGEVEESCAERSASVEIEEVTSVRIEFERTADGEDHAAARQFLVAPTDEPAEAARRLTPRRASATHGLRGALAVVGLCILIPAGLLAFRFVPRTQPPSREEAPITLPREPGRRALAVMFFENRSGSAELDWLRQGLADMLITDLSRSAKLSVLGRQQLRQLIERSGRGPERDISLDEALGVARGISAEAVVTGSFARLDGKTRVDVQLYDARTGALLAAEHTVADEPGRILTEIDILSLKLAAHLDVAPAAQDAGAGLAGVMTDSLEAYRYYSLAVEKARALHNEEAIALLERAVRLDPEFAMAYGRIGYAYAVTGPYALKARPYLEKAFKLSGRLTEKDRLYIVAWYSIANLDYPAAVAALRETVARYPLEVEAYLRLGYLLRGEGQHEEALDVLGRGLAVDPAAKDIYNALGLVNLDLRRHDEALAAHRRYVELAPAEPNAHDSLGMSYQCAGLYGEAAAAYERALALDPGFLVTHYHLANVYVQTGRYEAALAQVRRGLESAPGDRERAVAYELITQIYLRKGDPRRAAEAARVTLRHAPGYTWASWLVATERGDVKAARRLSESFSTPLYAHRGQRLPARREHYARGQMALIEGRGAEALEHFRDALRHPPLIWTTDQLEDCLANAYLRLGMLDEAIAEYERVLRLNPNYPLAAYRLAQAYERKGGQQQARAAYSRFLQAWKDADADVPEVGDARNRLSRQ